MPSIPPPVGDSNGKMQQTCFNCLCRPYLLVLLVLCWWLAPLWYLTHKIINGVARWSPSLQYSSCDSHAPSESGFPYSNSHAPSRSNLFSAQYHVPAVGQSSTMDPGLHWSQKKNRRVLILILLIWLHQPSLGLIMQNRLIFVLSSCQLQSFLHERLSPAVSSLLQVQNFAHQQEQLRKATRQHCKLMAGWV